MSQSSSIHSSPLESEGEASATAANDEKINVHTPLRIIVTSGGKRRRVAESTDDAGGRGTSLLDLLTGTEGSDCGSGGTSGVVFALYD